MYFDSVLFRDDVIISLVVMLCGELGVVLSGLREGEKFGEMMGVVNVVFRLVNCFDLFLCDFVFWFEKFRCCDIEIFFVMDS